VRLLLDTHILLAIINERTELLPRAIQDLLTDPCSEFRASIASLWEIAIKWRLGKLPLTINLHDLPSFCAAAKITLLSINAQHVLTLVDPEPPTRDPFDRLLLAQCAVEGLRLVTVDRALFSHRLAAGS
jgi:PIN domain nuclease of toxin-antitoxin system